MDFHFNQEQQQFADALRRWVDKDYPFETRKQIVHSATGTSDSAWATLAELGMTALPLPAGAGGFDGTAVDMLLVMEELGRGLVVEPYFATVLGARFLTLAGGHDAMLEQVASGSLKLACALGERQSRHDMHDIATTATASGDGFVLDGIRLQCVRLRLDGIRLRSIRLRLRSIRLRLGRIVRISLAGGLRDRIVRRLRAEQGRELRVGLAARVAGIRFRTVARDILGRGR